MKLRITQLIVPTLLLTGSLGLSVAAVTPAGASTKTTTTKTAVKAKTTVTGSIIKVEGTKSIFWLKVGSKTYRVNYSKATKFTSGSAKLLKKGLSVSVAGAFEGKSHVVISAESIKA